MQRLLLLGILFGGIVQLSVGQGLRTSDERDICYYPKKYKYPCEVHRIRTADGYILAAARIPYSTRRARRTKNRKRPVALLMHGIIWSSDCWLTPDPTKGLPYMLVDAGYDVWLGNVRGNIYSKNHVSKSTTSPGFWDFSWHEMGVYDLPATINYILATTRQRNLHYVGHSQGTTMFLVWLSTYPRESLKIKTSHLLAPVGFVSHIPLPATGNVAPIFGQPGPWIDSIGPNEIAGRSEFFNSLPQICNAVATFRDLCSDLFSLIFNQTARFNRTLLPEVLATFPSSSSIRQFIHYLQEYNSGYFRQYDYGREQNLRVYSRVTPPDYRVDLIKTSSHINLYYGDNDFIVSPIDVHKLAGVMRRTVELHPIIGRSYNHLDFLMAIDTKEVLNDCILAKMDRHERKPFRGNACCLLSGVCFRTG